MTHFLLDEALKKSHVMNTQNCQDDADNALTDKAVFTVSNVQPTPAYL